MVEEPAPCCLEFAQRGTHSLNCPKVQEYTFGVTVEKNGQRYKSKSGRFPSPANPDSLTVVSRVVEFLNEILGTNYAVIECYDDSQVEEVAPGEYKLKEGMNAQKEESESAKVVAIETG